MADGNINAKYIGILLIEDHIHDDSGLARLSVPNDELPLTPANGDHGIDAFEAGLQRFLYRLSLDDVGGPSLDQPILFPGDGPFSIDGLSDSVNHPSDEGISHGHREDPSRPLDGIPLFDLGEVPQDHGPDVILLQIEGHAEDVVRKLEHLRRHDVGKSLDPGDAIPRLDDLPHLLHIHADLIRLDLLPQYG